MRCMMPAEVGYDLGLAGYVSALVALCCELLYESCFQLRLALLVVFMNS